MQSTAHAIRARCLLESDMKPIYNAQTPFSSSLMSHKCYSSLLPETMLLFLLPKYRYYERQSNKAAEQLGPIKYRGGRKNPAVGVDLCIRPKKKKKNPLLKLEVFSSEA